MLYIGCEIYTLTECAPSTRMLEYEDVASLRERGRLATIAAAEGYIEELDVIVTKTLHKVIEPVQILGTARQVFKTGKKLMKGGAWYNPMSWKKKTKPSTQIVDDPYPEDRIIGVTPRSDDQLLFKFTKPLEREQVPGSKVGWSSMAEFKYPEANRQDVTGMAFLNDNAEKDKSQYYEYRSANFGNAPLLEAKYHNRGHSVNYLTDRSGVPGHKWHDPKPEGRWHNPRLALDKLEDFKQYHMFPKSYIQKNGVVAVGGRKKDGTSVAINTVLCLTTLSMAFLGSF